MASILVTGSSTGLGLLAGKHLTQRGHDVVFHARNAERAEDIRREHPGVDVKIVTGDLASTSEAYEVATQVNHLGDIDAVIHNAGRSYNGPPRRTVDGLPEIFAVNVLAPYVLTASIPGPRRLVYLSSGMHRVTPMFDDILWRNRSWSGSRAYSESKFCVTALAFAVARLFPHCFSNAVDPGWVPTRMGGASAPDDLVAGATTQVELAIGRNRQLAGLTGQYLHHSVIGDPDSRTRDIEIQDGLLGLCEALSGLSLAPQAA